MEWNPRQEHAWMKKSKKAKKALISSYAQLYGNNSANLQAKEKSPTESIYGASGADKTMHLDDKE